ncbi:MAG: anthranilate synthase component II [Opitutae bacterium]|nr:anthranilate synthase component II [Opitutae bacterium]|tara:strand:- start:3487 stop:4092 length:606 start_codon:yes stop_codon:yes gene_type:complete
MILLVDHQDSFTRNLEHLLARFDEVIVCDRLQVDSSLIERCNLVVLSPGPGKPQDYPETRALYFQCLGNKPILGICLGFQLMLEAEGAKIIRQAQVLHGVDTEIEVNPESATYQGLPRNLKVARYHSLQVDPRSLDNLSPTLKVTAHDPIRKVPLSFEDNSRALFGLQFHPESFLTQKGHRLIENIRCACLDDIGESRRTS